MKNTDMNTKILWVDDDRFFLEALRLLFLDVGIHLQQSHDLAHAMNTLNEGAERFDAVVLDIRFPPTADLMLATKAGHESGWYLARWIKEKWPTLKVIACSSTRQRQLMDWFETKAHGYLRRDMEPQELVKSVQQVIGAPESDLTQSTHVSTFIVHGHDVAELYQLKNFIQNSLRLPEPIILREQPSAGRTIIENLERYAKVTNVVFVLFTPDDLVTGSGEQEVRRARQNVVFELGYFYGRFGRTSGRILVLHKGPIELPSDISGMIFINIEHGIQSAGESIRRELGDLL